MSFKKSDIAAIIKEQGVDNLTAKTVRLALEARLGVLRTTLLNQAILAGNALGVPVQELAEWYRPKPPPSPRRIARTLAEHLLRRARAALPIHAAPM